MTAHEATHTFGASALSSTNETNEDTEILDENLSTNINNVANIHSNSAYDSGAEYENIDSMENDSPQNSNNRKHNEFVCKFCGKRYAYASSLYVHTRLHTGERPFKCNFCDKSFTNQGNMQVHKRVHTGEKPYGCNSCGKSYAQKVGLKIHQEQCKNYMNRRGSVMTSSASCASSAGASPISNSNDTLTSQNASSFNSGAVQSELLRISPRYVIYIN